MRIISTYNLISDVRLLTNIISLNRREVKRVGCAVSSTRTRPLIGGPMDFGGDSNTILEFELGLTRPYKTG
jgi:hypothetical protein